MTTPRTPIRPSDINWKLQFFDAFNSRETEASASWIVQFCEQNNGNTWERFQVTALFAFCRANGHRGEFSFNRLIPKGYVTIKDGVCTVTAQFVAKCYAAQPAG